MTKSVQMSSNKCSCSTSPFGWDDDKDLAVFAKFGEDASKFTAVPMQFGAGLQAAILQWLYSNKGITLDVLANNINKPVEEIQAEVDIMVEERLVRVVDGIIQVLPQAVALAELLSEAFQWMFTHQNLRREHLLQVTPLVMQAIFTGDKA
jgi:hypothetical protein